MTQCTQHRPRRDTQVRLPHYADPTAAAQPDTLNR